MSILNFIALGIIGGGHAKTNPDRFMSSSFSPPRPVRTDVVKNQSAATYENDKMVEEQFALEKIAKKIDQGVRVKVTQDGYSYLAYPHSIQYNTQPALEKGLRKLEKYARERGYTIIRSDMDRTAELSDQCSKQGKDAYVAPGGESAHNYGAGADLVLLDSKGKVIPFNSKKREVEAIVRYAQLNCGLSWGGSWADNESHHFQVENWEVACKTPERLWTNAKYKAAKKRG